MFSAAVPEKLIKEVTGHKSTQALQLYERPTVEQKQAVSNVITGGSRKENFSSELCRVQNQPPVSTPQPPQRQALQQLSMNDRRVVDSSSWMSSMFNGLTNCTINITPQNFNVNFNPQPKGVEDEFDTVVSSMKDDMY